MKPKILIVTEVYLPGVKAGGPIQSIKNIVHTFHESFDFYIVASDRDFGDSSSYDSVALNRWIKYGLANIFYINKSELTFSRIEDFITERDYCVIYLNSFFNWNYSIKWIIGIKKLEYLGRIVLAPRGEFSQGAYRQKFLKKKLFTMLAGMSGMYNRIVWHATSQDEVEDIKRVWNLEANILLAENVSEELEPFQRGIEKKQGELKAVYISRIHPKKNLLYALELFHYIKGNVVFHIYGPIEEDNYWMKCKEIISLLPKNIQVIYEGLLDHEDVKKILKLHHLFILPTLGENFGHSIVEAMSVGTPVIISDQTPWHRLREHYAGFDIGLEQKEIFVESIQCFVDMNNIEYRTFEKGAYRFVYEEIKRENVNEKYLKLFTRIS